MMIRVRSVDIVTRLRSGQPRNLGSISQEEQERLLFSEAATHTLGPVQPPPEWIPRYLAGGDEVGAM